MPASLVTALGVLAVIAAGVCVALQQVLNARLRIELGSPWWAGAASYAVGLLVMMAMVAASGAPRLDATAIARTSWASWTGGILGAVFIATALIMVPRFGAAAVLALIVLGQMAGSLTVDHLGLFGVAQHPAAPVRLAGAALLVLGVVLVRR